MNELPTVNAVDDRIRLIAGLVIGVSVAVSARVPDLFVGSVQGVVCLALARNEWRRYLRRFTCLNVFLGAIVLILPFNVPGTSLLVVDLLGGVAYSRSGLAMALVMTWRANVIFAVCWSLIGTMQPVRLGTALLDLKLSTKLAQLVYFSFRTVDELRDDYVSIRRAMAARGFTLGIASLKGTGYLLGNLLTRSLDKSDRILWAMKSRAFVDTFPRLSVTLRLQAGDWTFAVLLLAPTVAVLVIGGYS